MILNSGDANGLRASESHHAVEHARADRDLGRLGADLACPQAGSGEHLESVHQGLGKRSPVVADSLLPFTSAALSDSVNGRIAPSCAGRAVRSRHRALAWRSGRGSAARINLRVALLGVVGTIAANGLDRYVGGNLVEQIGQHFAVAHVLMGHQRGADLAGVRVHRQMDLAPSAALGPTVLAHLPFAFAIELQAGTVDHQVQWLASAPHRQHNLQSLCAARQRRVMRYLQIRKRELAQAARKALQCAQRQTKDLLETKQALNQGVRLDQGVAASRRLYSRCHAHALVDPHRLVSSCDQSSVVRRPVLDAVLRLGFRSLLGRVPAHVLGKNRESTQELSLFTALPPHTLRVNVSTPRVGPDLCNALSIVMAAPINDDHSLNAPRVTADLRVMLEGADAPENIWLVGVSSYLRSALVSIIYQGAQQADAIASSLARAK